MSNFKSRCSLFYHDLPFDKIETFAFGVKEGYFKHNPPFTVQPFTEAAFKDLILDYANKRGAYVNGGLAQKGDFLLAHTALIAALDTLALQVDVVSNCNKDLIVLAGFEPTKDNISEGAKPGQCVVKVKRGMERELISNCKVVRGTKFYGCLIAVGAPLPVSVTIDDSGNIHLNKKDAQGHDRVLPDIIINLTSQREKHFANLEAGVIYYFYCFAVNATGVGPLSEAVHIMCA